MEISLVLPNRLLEFARRIYRACATERGVVALALVFAVGATAVSWSQGWIIAYGDAESHLNIAKRVVDSLTPGFAQLGGIWLPLPHILMIPFVKIDFLWRSGLAGAIVSGAAFVVSSLVLFKLTNVVLKSRVAAFVAALVFMLNPNVLYLQSTPMTEILLIMFFLLSSYFFIRFIQNRNNVLALLLAAFFGFLGTLTRYDAWFLVGMEGLIIGLIYFPFREIWQLVRGKGQQAKQRAKNLWQKVEGRGILFGTLALFGIFLWLLWDFLILGDPLYFTTSEFSARSQQEDWHSRGMLPSYHNPWLSFLYYFVTSMANIGIILFVVSLIGLALFFFAKEIRQRWWILLVLAVPFIFNVLALFLGQGVIFIPHITSFTFDWTLFNVRYGVMMVPFAAFFLGYLFLKMPRARVLLLGLFVLQFGLYGVGYSKVTSWEDGARGLSSQVSKTPHAQGWLKENYDHGLVLIDDYARTVSIIRADIPLENVIYIGNKPYWEESLQEPEKYARWIVLQQNDAVWNALWSTEAMQGRIYKHFNKVYTSNEILIFRKMETETAASPQR